MGGKSGPGVCRWHRNGDQGMLCKGEKQEPRPGKREWGRGRNQRIFCLIQQGAVFIRTMKTKGKTKLRKDKRIHSSNLHSGVMVLHAFHLWKLKQCVGPKNEAQVGRSDRENKMQLTGAVLALPLIENTSQRECKMGKVNLLLIYNTMYILWVTKGLFEGNFGYSQSMPYMLILDLDLLAKFGFLKCVPDTRVGRR